MNDLRDYIVMVLVTCIMIAATIFLFLYHSETAFGTWSLIVTTVVSAYHWLNISDDKKPDA